MPNVWVIKDDGTRQCDDRNKGVSVKEMQKELELLGATVLSGEKRQDCRLISRVCGAPTGQVNAYEISEQDWQKVADGFVGPQGFRLWTCDQQSTSSEAALRGGEIPWPLARGITYANSAYGNPVLVRELVGRPVRVYHDGDLITQDFISGRVNIVLEIESQIIKDIWFG